MYLLLSVGHLDIMRTNCQAVNVIRTATPGTKERILESAFRLFGRYGFKRTSMEDIASEAGLSRAALYLQFRNKEDIFRALAAGLHEQCLSSAEAALAGEGPLAERLQTAVEGKTLPMVEMTNNSPHGSELMDESNRLCGDLAADSGRRFQKMLSDALSRSDGTEIDLRTAGVSAQEAAELFAASIHGLKAADITPVAFKKRLAPFVKVFVAGLR